MKLLMLGMAVSFVCGGNTVICLKDYEYTKQINQFNAICSIVGFICMVAILVVA